MKGNKKKIMKCYQTKTRTLLCFLLMLMLTLSSCGKESDDTSENSGQSADNSEEEVLIVDENAALFWSDDFSYGEITSPEVVYKAEYYLDGSLNNDYGKNPEEGDAKYLFGGENQTRIVNFPDGYMLTMPGRSIEADFSLSQLRNKFDNGESILTVSFEDKSPYGNNEQGWSIYLNEWINRYITSLDFLSNNNIRFTRKAQESTELIPGYVVITYDYNILKSTKIEFPYYNIAVIRQEGVYDEFYLMVMKSKETKESGWDKTLYTSFDEIIKSFTPMEKTGTAKNSQGQYELKIPEFWSEETKAYYDKLMNQDTVDWGVFAVSMPSLESEIQKQSERLTKELEMLQGEDALDYQLDIMPTYTHIGWYDQTHHFPSAMAEEFAGGNGFNGKPVLQFSYQFTLTNNSDMFYKTPMYDILRGYYDDQFRKLAQDIKAYGKPVLFRLNNEMNTDWTSYAGVLTMLDPDFFIETWEHLYDIFVEEGVDNCIWIFNPIAKSCPFSNWGEAVNYMPGADYVQALGLTYYESGNGEELRSFEDMYKELYDINSPFFLDYPWIISEFGCGAGGAKQYDYSINAYVDTVLGRNIDKQAQWVKGMFDCIASGEDYVKNIKGAVWFSANDYATVEGTSYVTNYFKLDDTERLAKTFEELRKGLAKTVNK